ncbi:MAG: methylaspartate mutase subunit E [Erysipelothrix sp.]|jgi:methylaspartate mutase epsilon subunit|nr:methylaspartate mutase subunit E [Erysipelothrix sp.]
MNIKNKKIELADFMKLREQVLLDWPTGKEVDLEEAFAFHKNLPIEQSFSALLSEAKQKQYILIQPRAGVAALNKHIELLQYLQDEGTADCLPSTIDSYTRHNRYKEAQQGLEESIVEGRSLLNGFPAVNHGVAGCRRVVQSLKVPVQVRHGTPDARLLAEITLAGGYTSFEGGGISYNIPYSKNISLEQTIRDWMYVDRLVGLYQEQGISINREPYGPLTGTLVPPSISHAVAIVESLLAAEQGVKDITVGYGQCGNLIQDVAAIRTLESLTQSYLEEHGYHDVMITTVMHQWMGGFPQDEAKAYGVITWGAATAAFAGATKVIVKSPHEAMGIPTREANAQGLLATKQVVSMLKDQRMPNTLELLAEMKIIEMETRSIVDKMFELGEGDIALGTIRGFEAGVIDIPFAPSKNNKGLILPARDNVGAIRYLETGNLPFNDEIKAFNKNKLQERADYEKREVSFQMVIDDVYAIGKGKLIGRATKGDKQ